MRERKDEPVGRDGVEVRSRASRVSAEPDSVRAAGVDRHEDDVSDAVSRRHGVGPPAPLRKNSDRKDREGEDAFHPEGE